MQNASGFSHCTKCSTESNRICSTRNIIMRIWNMRCNQKLVTCLKLILKESHLTELRILHQDTPGVDNRPALEEDYAPFWGLRNISSYEETYSTGKIIELGNLKLWQMIRKEHSRKQDKQQFNNITKHEGQQP
eukprot:TRINITY_DN30096_c2_g1_i1.p1 TRINITY_DN30096_c2_g1~~TRINITY_DN30096_c2_g1_i1.p1  ORF type:complete len:133 (+),score=7.55 TRINITY_DN30096_c2_g1_i1:279-677(+)